MTQIDIDRKAIKENAENESLEADMKQHADKLIRGFEAQDDTYAKRGIWELIQNARDLSTEAEIIITLEKDLFSFSHNGKPFTSKTLLSLIKQVSSKSSEKLDEINLEGEEVEEVGQYGTGFITTHAFGKKFTIDGSLKVNEDTYIDLQGFEINRIASSSKILVKQLANQQKQVYHLIETGNISKEKKNTTFKYYFEDSSEFKRAESAVTEYTDGYIPIVMALNGHIKSITLQNNISGTSTKFVKNEPYTENGIKVTPVKKDNDEPFNIYSLYSTEFKLEVVLPLETLKKSKKWNTPLSKLFLYFPLIGTENWGTNFIIHCDQFSPTEKRDGIHLISDNKQTKEKEANNVLLLNHASKMIFDYLKLNSEKIEDPINLAIIGFNTISGTPLLNNYYVSLKANWVEKFKELPLVQTKKGLISPRQTSFLEESFFKVEKYFDDIFKVVSIFWDNVPNKYLTKEWTEITKDWEDKSIVFLTLEDVAKKIQSIGNLNEFDPEVLQNFYRFIYETKNQNLFEECELLPNIKNIFISNKFLRTAKTIKPVLIEISDFILPDIPRKFIHTDFILNVEFQDYTRKEFSDSLQLLCNERAKSLSSNNILDDNFRNALIRLCHTFPALDNKGVRGDLIAIISKYYGQVFEEEQIPHIENNHIDYNPALKCLLRHMLFDIVGRSLKDPGYVAENLSLINQILSLIVGKKEFEEITKTLSIFPNQNCTLCIQESLKRPDNIPEGLIEIHDEVINSKILNTLVHSESIEFVPAENIKTGGELALEINAKLESEWSLEDINKHPSKKVILKVIKKITENSQLWGELFQSINSKRAIIMMAKITNEDTKENLFSILELEDIAKIALLGNLAKDPDMALIIEFGKQKLAEDRDREADFEFKKSIGEHIEKLLRERLQDDLITEDIKVVQEQGGQDIVVKKGSGDNIIYRIEIKSKWSTAYTTTMSKLQLKTAVLNEDSYALCCVNMIGYYPEDGNRNYPENVALVIDRIKVIDDIGSEIAPLINKAMESDLTEDKVKLSGDYQVTIPVSMIDKGGKFNDFITELVGRLSKT